MDVLLVEDSDVVRREFERLIAGLAVVDRVVAAEGAAVAGREIERDTFDAWVLDFDLGDGTALDLIESLPGDSGAHRPSVFVVTNHGSPALRERCLDAGADRFFDKSGDLDALFAALEDTFPDPTAA